MDYFFDFLMLPGMFFLGGLAIASVAWIGVVTKVKSEQKRWQGIADTHFEKIDDTSTEIRNCRMELAELQKLYNTMEQQVKLKDMEIEDLQKLLKGTRRTLKISTMRWQWDILSTILEGYISHMPVCQLEVSENSITNQLAKAAVQYGSIKGRKVPEADIRTLLSR